MKKGLIVILSALVIVGTIAGCADTPKKVEGTEQVQQKQETFNVGDTIQTKDYNITVNSVETAEGGEFIKPKDGKEFLKVDITIVNTSKEVQTISSMAMFKVVDKDGRAQEQTFTEEDNGQLDGELGAGRKMSGEYVVEVPKGATDLELEFDSSLFNNGAQIIVKLN